MPENSGQERTERATPKRKQEARKKGQVAKSKDLSAVAVLSAGVLYLYFGAQDLVFNLGSMIQGAFRSIPDINSNDFNLVTLLPETVEKFLIMLIPIMIVVCIAALIANFLQTGPILNVESLTPKASKINPIEGAKKILSLRSLVELSKSILKIVIVGWVAFSIFKNEFTNMIPLMYQDHFQILTFLSTIAIELLIKCCCVIAILAILDFMYQKWDFNEKLKMTKQEVKDEFKQTEGDPIIKARIKAIQREMARKRMMAEVPKADVVITNPTHLSVALHYDPEGNRVSPIILAKGANNIAFKIREIAKQNNIPIVENKSLAQNLYKLDLGGEIPPQFYQAVAEILAYVYGLKNKKTVKG